LTGAQRKETRVRENGPGTSIDSSFEEGSIGLRIEPGASQENGKGADIPQTTRRASGKKKQSSSSYPKERPHRGGKVDHESQTTEGAAAEKVPGRRNNPGDKKHAGPGLEGAVKMTPILGRRLRDPNMWFFIHVEGATIEEGGEIGNGLLKAKTNANFLQQERR